jgi:hypothetical protein
MNNRTPQKPKNQKEQISMLWDAVYNHLPSRLNWQDKKLNFILIFMGLILAALAIGTPIVINLITQ